MTKKKIILIILPAVAVLCALGILIFGNYEISAKNEIYLQNAKTGEFVCVDERTCVITNKNPVYTPNPMTGYVIDYDRSQLKISSLGAFLGVEQDKNVLRLSNTYDYFRRRRRRSRFGKRKNRV